VPLPSQESQHVCFCNNCSSSRERWSSWHLYNCIYMVRENPFRTHAQTAPRRGGNVSGLHRCSCLVLHGPGADIVIPRASAAFAGVTNDAGASPFEGQLLMSLLIATFMQCLAHMRLPVIHVIAPALFGAVLTLILASTSLWNANSSSQWPSSVVGLGIRGIFVSVSAQQSSCCNSSVRMGSKVPRAVVDGRCCPSCRNRGDRTFCRTFSVAVVQDQKARRATQAVLVHNVVILVSSEVMGNISNLIPAVKRCEVFSPSIIPGTLTPSLITSTVISSVLLRLQASYPY